VPARSLTTSATGLAPVRRDQPGAGLLRKRQLENLVAQVAPGHLDDGDVADLLAEQGLAARAGGEDLVFEVVLLARADELVLLLLAGLEVL